MPNSERSRTLRITTGFVDTVNDQFPGGGSVTPGLAPGQVKALATLDQPPFPYFIANNQLEGTVQYVQTLSTDTTASAQGYSAFWSDRANGIVTTDGVTAGIENFAGLFVSTITPGNYGFIKRPGLGGRAMVNFSGATPTAGAQAVAQTSVNATTAASGTDIKSYHIGTCQGVKTAGQLALVALKGGES